MSQIVSIVYIAGHGNFFVLRCDRHEYVSRSIFGQLFGIAFGTCMLAEKGVLEVLIFVEVLQFQVLLGAFIYILCLSRVVIAD